MSGVAGTVAAAWHALKSRHSKDTNNFDDSDIMEDVETKEVENTEITTASQKTLRLIKAIEDNKKGRLTDKELCDIIQSL